MRSRRPRRHGTAHLHGERVAGVDLVLVRVAGAWLALSDECTHAGCLLSEDGELLDGVLICNCHGSEFAPASGELLDWTGRRAARDASRCASSTGASRSSCRRVGCSQ